jgi:hypothetical protein
MCEQGYLDLNTKLCQQDGFKPIDHCKVYQDGKPQLCRMCEYGFGVHWTDNSCKQCTVDACAICNQFDTLCQACFAPLYLNRRDNGTFECVVVADRLPFKCLINGARKDSIEEQCGLCHKGFSVHNGFCISEVIRDCWVLTSDKLKCQRCIFGFYITKEGTCLPNNQERPMWPVWTVGVVSLLALLVGLVLCCLPNRRQNNAAYYYKN